MSLEDKAQAWRGPSIPGAVQRSPSRGPCPVNRSRAPGHVYFQDWGLRAEPQSWCWGEVCLSSYEPRPRSRRVHGFSPSTPSTTSVDSYSSQLLWEAGAQIRRGAGPGLRGAAPARLWGVIPGGEGNLEGDRGGGCVDRSCLQQPTAWGHLEGHEVPVWLLLACRMGRTRRQLHAPPAALTPASWCFCCCPPPGGGVGTSDGGSGRQRSNSQGVWPISTGPQAPSWGSQSSRVGEEGLTHLSARPSSFGSHSGS